MEAIAGSHWLHGNAIFIASVISVLLGIVQGGVQYPWDSWRTILPLVLGMIGLMLLFT